MGACTASKLNRPGSTAAGPSALDFCVFALPLVSMEVFQCFPCNAAQSIAGRASAVCEEEPTDCKAAVDIATTLRQPCAEILVSEGAVNEMSRLRQVRGGALPCRTHPWPLDDPSSQGRLWQRFHPA